MDSMTNPIVLDGLKYVVWGTDIEMMLKSKGLWKYMKTTILDSSDVATKFVVDGKKDEVVGVSTTYISPEIRFHTSGIDFPHVI